jgi:hypothetical protein
VTRASFLIPLRDNDGNPFEYTDFTWLNGQLVTRFTGYTRDGIVSGEWFESGVRYADDSYRFVVAIANEQLETLAALLEEACERFKQEALYLETIEADVRLVRPRRSRNGA